MKTFALNTLAVIAGIIIGSIVNILLVNLGPVLVPLPEGADVSSMEGLRASMQLFSPLNFLFPFLGHALGTLVGSFIAAKLAASHALYLAMGIGAFFLMGGVAAASMIGAPVWFNLADLILAYLPMAYLGYRLAGSRRSPSGGLSV